MTNSPPADYLSILPLGKSQLFDRSAWEFFAGLASERQPQWTRKLEDRQPVFEDKLGGVGWNMSVSFNAGLKRYLLMTEHGESHRGKLGIFDAPEPWGP